MVIVVSNFSKESHSLGLFDIDYFDVLEIKAYFVVLIEFVQVIYAEVIRSFAPYMVVDILTAAKSPGEYQMVILLPFTTFAASAFGTTMWISLCWFVIAAAVLICRVQQVCLKAAVAIHEKHILTSIVLMWLLIVSAGVTIVKVFSLSDGNKSAATDTVSSDTKP